MNTEQAPTSTIRRPFSGRMFTVASGVGIPLYLAGAMLIPQEGSEQSIAGSLLHSLRK
jgi:hypothetical protein